MIYGSPYLPELVKKRHEIVAMGKSNSPYFMRPLATLSHQSNFRYLHSFYIDKKRNYDSSGKEAQGLEIVGGSRVYNKRLKGL